MSRLFLLSSSPCVEISVGDLVWLRRNLAMQRQLFVLINGDGNAMLIDFGDKAVKSWIDSGNNKIIMIYKV